MFAIASGGSWHGWPSQQHKRHSRARRRHMIAQRPGRAVRKGCEWCQCGMPSGDKVGACCLSIQWTPLQGLPTVGNPSGASGHAHSAHRPVTASEGLYAWPAVVTRLCSCAWPSVRLGKSERGGGGGGGYPLCSHRLLRCATSGGLTGAVCCSVALVFNVYTARASRFDGPAGRKHRSLCPAHSSLKLLLPHCGSCTWLCYRRSHLGEPPDR